MFTEIDYRDYFTAIQEAEKKMFSYADNIINNLSDPKILRVLSGIRNVELKHLQLEDELFAILDEQKMANKR